MFVISIYTDIALSNNIFIQTLSACVCAEINEFHSGNEFRLFNARGHF